MERSADAYPARLEIDYPEELDRLSTLLRIIFIIPIGILTALMPAPGGSQSAGGSGALMFLPLVLVMLFRRRYPRWWFDFQLEYTRFITRVTAYFDLLTDRYPSTVEEQSVHLELDYPDADQLIRWLPLVKWLLLLPHYIVMIVLSVLGLIALIVSWFAILINGRYPRPLFDFIVGVNRYGLRVSAYGFLLITDRYPPFRLSA